MRVNGSVPGTLGSTVPAPRRRSPFRASYAFAILIGVAICLTWGSVYVHLLREYRQTSFDAMQKARNTAYGFAENLERSFEALDQSLLFLRESYLRDPDGFDLVALSRGPVVGRRQVQVTLVDGEGQTRAAASGPPGGSTWRRASRRGCAPAGMTGCCWARRCAAAPAGAGRST